MAESTIKPARVIKLPFSRWRREKYKPPRGTITAIDLDGQTLRVVQTQQHQGKVRFTRVAVEELDFKESASQPQPLELGKAIAKALAHSRIKPTQVVMGIPRAQVVLRALMLPAISDVRELASLVHFQIAKELPFKLGDAIIDFKVRRSADRVSAELTQKIQPELKLAEDDPATPKLDVLVAVVKREVVNYYQQVMVAAGLKLAALGFRPYANARCVMACRVMQGDESVAFVSLRPDEVLVDVISEQDLVFSRGSSTKVSEESLDTAYVTDSQLPKDEPEDGLAADSGNESKPEARSERSLLDAITIEVVRSFHSVGGMGLANPVSQLVVAGATGHEQSVVEALRKRLSAPCELLEPARALDLPAESRDYASGAIAALGLGLGVFDPQGLPFNFLNPKRPAIRRNLRRIRILTATAAVAVLVMLLGGIESYLLRQKGRTRDRLAEQLKVEEGRRDLYRLMRIQALAIKKWEDGGRNWLNHYAHLSAVLPSCEEVYVTALSVSSQGNITLAVQARSGEVLAELEKQLRAAGYEVQPLAIKPGKDKFGYPFRSSVELRAPDKLQIDLTKLQPPGRPEDDGSLDSVKGGGS